MSIACGLLKNSRKDSSYINLSLLKSYTIEEKLKNAVLIKLYGVFFKLSFCIPQVLLRSHVSTTIFPTFSLYPPKLFLL